MRIPIVFATNDKYVPHCRVAIASLLDHACAQNEYVLYIFHSGLSEASLAALTAFARPNAQIVPMNIESLLQECMFEMKWYTREIYYRLMAADALPQEDKILYLDCDIVVLEDVARLYAVELGDTLVGALPSRRLYSQRMSAKLSLDVRSMFNSGVLLFNLAQWRAQGIFAQCVDALRRFQGRLLYPDQDALAIACGHSVTRLDDRWNGMTCRPNRQGVARDGIVHLFSCDKPWNSDFDSNYAYYYAYARRLGLLPEVRRPVGPDRIPQIRRRFNGVPSAPLRALCKRVGALGYCAASAYVPRFRMPFKRLRVCVSTRCPANCAHCEAMCPQYAQRADIDAGQLASDLAKLLAHTRRIGQLRLTGGEPFAHAGLAGALRTALQNGRVERVIVETPGLVRPDAQTAALLRDERVCVELHGGVDIPLLPSHFDLYDRPGRPDAPALEEAPNLVASEDWVWAEYGPFERRDVTDEELYWQARACGMGDYYYLNGRLFPCARMAHGMALGLLPEAACSFVEIRRESSAWRIARALDDLVALRGAEACRYCLRGTTQFFPVPREA